MVEYIRHRVYWITKLISYPDVNALWKVCHLHKTAYITSLCAVWPVGLLCIRTGMHCEGTCVTQWAMAHSPGRTIRVFSPTKNLQPLRLDGYTLVKAKQNKTKKTAGLHYKPCLGKCQLATRQSLVSVTYRCFNWCAETLSLDFTLVLFFYLFF